MNEDDRPLGGEASIVGSHWYFLFGMLAVAVIVIGLGFDHRFGGPAPQDQRLEKSRPVPWTLARK